MTIKTGTKFFRYPSSHSKPEIVRITRMTEDSNEVKIRHEEDGKVETVRLQYLKNHYHMLKADGMISICLVGMDDKTDVLVTLCNLREGIDVNVICRQLVSDIFTNNMKKSDNVDYVGMSISRETCPAEVDFNSILACDRIIESRFIAVYLDDTLDDILSLFNKKKFDDALRELCVQNRNSIRNKITNGYCSSIRELLSSNNFMYDFHRTFGVYEITFTPNMESESLSISDTNFLKALLKENITDTYVTEYSREIDTTKFNRKWILVTCHEENYSKVYIVGYDVEDVLG